MDYEGKIFIATNGTRIAEVGQETTEFKIKTN